MRLDGMSLTSCVNKLRVILGSKQRIRKVPEKLLRESCNTVDIVVEVLRVGKVDLRGIWLRLDIGHASKVSIQLTIIEHSLHMANMVGTSRKSIDTLHIQTEQLYGLETLVHKERNGSSIPGVRSFSETPNTGFKGGRFDWKPFSIGGGPAIGAWTMGAGSGGPETG